MGNLHAGHLSLVEYARSAADVVVVSIFVNPLQFGANEDFANYPRTLEADCALLEAAGTDIVFAPTETDLYPFGRDHTTTVIVPIHNEILCGASRPGHFNGVSSVVARLFHAVQPNIAIFGQKDYQQLLVLRRMTQELLMPIEIIGLPTQRHSDGLAMSSRNAYLSPQQRQIAPALYQSLQAIVQALQAGQRDVAALEQQHIARLQQWGFQVDYLSVRRQADLMEVQATDKAWDWVVLAAAWLGRARLIDNLEVY